MPASNNDPQEDLSAFNALTLHDDVQAGSTDSDSQTMPNDVIAMVVDELLTPLLDKNERDAEIDLRRSILRQWIRGKQTFQASDSLVNFRAEDISQLITPLSKRESGDLFKTLTNLGQTNKFGRAWIQKHLWENERIRFKIPDDHFADDLGSKGVKVWLKVMMNDRIIVPERFLPLIKNLEVEMRTCGALLQQTGNRYLRRRFLFGTPKLRALETLTFRFFGDVSIVQLVDLQEPCGPVSFPELVNAESIKTVKFVRHYAVERPSLAGIQAYWPDHPAFGPEKTYPDLRRTFHNWEVAYGPGVQGSQGNDDPSTVPTAAESRTQAANVEEFDRQLLLHWAGPGSPIDHTLETKTISAAEVPERAGMYGLFSNVPSFKDHFTFLTSTLTISKPEDYEPLPKEKCPLYRFSKFRGTLRKRANIATFDGDQELMQRTWTSDSAFPGNND